MEPLTISVSALGLIQITVQAANAVLRAVQAVKDGPVELLQLSNEVTDLSLVLTSVQESLEQERALIASRLAPAPELGGRLVTTQAPTASAALRRLTDRANAHLADLASIVKKQRGGQHTLMQALAGARGPAQDRSRLRAIHDELRDIKQSLAVHFSVKTLSYAFKSVLVADQMAADMSEVREHARSQEAQLASVLECLSRDYAPEPMRLVSRQMPAFSEIPTGALTEQVLNTTAISRLDISRFKKLPCRPFCSCACHRRHRYRSPTLANKLLGSLMVGYSSLPLLGTPCEQGCLQRSRFSATFTYYFPSWFLAPMLSFLLMQTVQGDVGALLRVRWIQYTDFSMFRFATGGDVAGIKSLFRKRNIHPSSSWYGGWTPLHYAISHGRIAVCRLLLSERADPLIEDGDNQQSALEYAWTKILGKAFPGPVLKEFQETFTDKECLEEMGFSIIHKIVLELCGSDLHQTLQTHDGLINVPDAEGRTPVFWAAYRGDLDAVTTLLAHGADPNIKNRAGTSPLWATVSGHSPECIVPLLDAGAEVDAVDCRLHTPLMEGCDKHNRLDFIQPLVEAGANVNAVTDYDFTPLIMASAQNHSVCAKYLIQQGAEVDRKGQTGRTPVAFAIEYNSHETLELLLDAGADCSIPTDLEPTILHIAARDADLQTLEILIDKVRLTLTPNDLSSVDHQGLGIDDILNARNDGAPGAELVEAFDALIDKVVWPEFYDAVEILEAAVEAEFHDAIENIGPVDDTER